MSIQTLRIKPILIVRAGDISEADVQKLTDNGVCVVQAKDPSRVRFVEPPPMDCSAHERAALASMRHLLSSDNVGAWNRGDVQALFARYIIRGTPLAATPVSKAKS